MGPQSWPVALATVCLLGAHSATADFISPSSLEPRRLSAANVPSSLRSRRSESGLFTREASFDFIEDTAKYGDSSFVSTVAVNSQKPILALEDIEDLAHISCSDSWIELSFVSIERLGDVKEELSQSSDFIAVTSHPGCNGDGERASHKVSNVAIDELTGVVTLSSSRCEWREAFPSMDVSFSRRDSSQVQRRDTIAKRQSQQEPETTVNPRATPTREFPTPPTGTNIPQNITDSIDKSFIDLAIMPPDSPIAGLFIPEGVVLSCNNCTLAGDIDFSQGSFSVSPKSDNILAQVDDVIDDVVDFFSNGTVEVITNGLFGHIELGMNLSVPQEVPFTATLPPIPLSPFAIPGIVAFGPMIVPEFIVSFAIEASASFSYGFNLTIPDGSSFTLDVGEISNSTMTGFDEAIVNAFPFQSDYEIEQSITFSVSFTPQILLGVSTAAGFAKGGIGASFDLPKVSIEISKLENVDEECNPPPVDPETQEDVEDDETPLGNFTNIVPSVELSFGVFGELTYDVGPIKDGGIEKELKLANFTLELPTACLGFDEETKAYETAANIVKAEEEGSGVMWKGGMGYWGWGVVVLVAVVGF